MHINAQKNKKIACERVICCAGQWSRALAASVGVNVPLVSVEHQYMITEPFDVPTNLPTLRDPDRLTYYKEEVGGLVMGGYEPNPIPWAIDGLPEAFDFTLLDSNYDHFEPIIEERDFRKLLETCLGSTFLIANPESFEDSGFGHEITASWYKARLIGLGHDYLILVSQFQHGAGKKATKEPMKQFIPFSWIKRISLMKSERIIHI